MASESQQQPPPPPPPGATPAITVVGGGKAVKASHFQKQTKGAQVKGARGRAANKNPDDAIMHIVLQPGPVAVPAGMAPPPPPPPGGGKTAIKKSVSKPEPAKLTDRLHRVRAKSTPKALTPKMEAAPTATKLETKRAVSETKKEKARSRSREPLKTAPAKKSSEPPVPQLVIKDKPASRAPSAQPAAKAKAKSRGPSARAAKRERATSTPAEPPIESIVVPRPSRGRSSTPGPIPFSGTGRRIESEPASFRGTPQRLRSRTPAPKASAASSSKDPAPPEETSESTGKSRKKEAGETAGKLKAPSKIKPGQIAEELAGLVKRGGWDPTDAARVVAIGKQMDGASPSTLNKLQDELKTIYKRNYNALKKEQNKPLKT